MKSYFRSSIYKRFTRFALTILSGNASMRSMILVCVISALIILAYVSTQIYAARTLDNVSELKQQQTLLQDNVNRLTARYAAVSSRSNVINYCEKNLGMVKATDTAVIRIAVEEGDSDRPELARLTVRPVWSHMHLVRHNTQRKAAR